MGCGPSTLAVAELNKSLAEEEGRGLLLAKLQSNPWLLSTPASVLSSTIGTPLHMACERMQVQVVEDMITFVVCSPLPRVHEALMPYCRRAGRPLPESVSEGVRLAVNMVNCKGQTPLMVACAAGCPQLVKLLLAQGADPWLGDYCGARAALHYAAMSGKARCVEALLQHLRPQDNVRQGVRYVNVRSRCGLSPLHYAMFFNHEEVVEELLRHDPQITAMTSAHPEDLPGACDALSSPLHFAARRGNLEAARQLLKYHLIHAPMWGTNQAQDPRLRSNHGNQLPWQVAATYHPGKRDLLTMLHPGEPLQRALGLPLGLATMPTTRIGPPPLANLAATALMGKLLADIAALQPPPPTRPAKGDEGGGAVDAAAAKLLAGATGGGGRRASGVSALQEPGVVALRSRSGGAVVGSFRSAGSGLVPVTRDSISSLTRLVSSVAESSAGGLPSESVGDSGDEEAEGQEVGRAGKGEREEEGGREECGVCLTEKVEVAMAGCAHGLCAGCAKQLSRGIALVARPRPVLCPFCRREVAGFRARGAAPPPRGPAAVKAA